MTILAIDPGYDRVGIAIINAETRGKPILSYSECFTTDRSKPFHDRLAAIGQRLETLIETYHPTHLAIETLLFNTNQKTALLVSEARGVMLYIARLHDITIHEYTPLQIKNAVTGYGRATKDQVNHMARQLITIRKDIAYDDEMDAIAIGITCEASEHGARY